jgi:hypothetical protein
MTKQIKTYKSFDYYLNKLIGVIATFTSLFFIAAWFDYAWATNLFPGKVSAIFIFAPTVLALYCFRTSDEEKKRFEKKRNK